MYTRTKLICTIGPSCNTLEMILKLIKAGMNVARLNFSHGTHEEHAQTISLIKEARQQLQSPIAIMLDTKGPELRLGKLKGGAVVLSANDRWLLVKDVIEGDSSKVTLLPGNVLDHLKPGMRLLIDDGYISSVVIENTTEGVLVEIQNSGIIKSGKGINIPEINLSISAITEKDKEDIRFGCQQGIDIIAASFVHSPENIMEIKKFLSKEKKSGVLIIAKIENSDGVQNLDGILAIADGIMIARGDLGVEVPLSQVPKLQKLMIRKSYLLGKPSITATQMLESMIQNPRPTRAEASDVANAIYDSTSAVMLSGETAIGKYPLETVNVMKSIVKEAEEDFNYRDFFDQHSKLVFHDVPSAVTLATVKTAYSSNAKAIFVFTCSGSTARLISRLRPNMPIIAMTPYEKAYYQMASNWGVIPFLGQECFTMAEAFEKLSAFALEQRLVEYGDLVVLTAGSPFGVKGTTNTMIVESIGDVLVRGKRGYGSKVYGKIAFVLSPELIQPYTVHDCLIVITRCDETYRPLIQESAGVILENYIHDKDSELFLLKIVKSLGRPCIVRADAATRVLKKGQLVTLDPEKANIYKGAVP